MRAIAAAAVAVLALALTFAGEGPAQAEDYPISVVVIDGGPGSGEGMAGSPSGSPAAVRGTAGGSASTGAGAAPAGDAPAGAPAVPSGSSATGAVLGVAGLTSQWRWSIDPAGGSIVTSVRLTNTGSRLWTGSARGWLTGPLGQRIGSGTDRRLRLAPGSSRVERFLLDGTGQWTLVTAHVAFAPARGANGAVPREIERNQTLVIPPWALLLILTGVLACGIPLRTIVRGRSLAPASSAAPA